MTNEIKVKRKLTEMRVHLSDKFLRGAAPKNADGKPKGSVGDDGIIGLRAHYWSGGTIAFYYHYSDKRNPHKRYKEKLGIFPTINVVQARNRAKVIAVKVMEEKSLSQIKRAMRTELNVTELYEEYEKGSLKAPRYKKTTIGKWDTMRRVWIERDTKDPVIRAMFAKSKVDIGSMKLSQVNMGNLKELHSLIGSKTIYIANAVIQQLSVVFGYAVEKKYIDVNPVKFRKNDYYEHKENNKYLTRTQMDTILSYSLKYDERSKDNPKLNMDYYTAQKLDVVSCCIIAKALMDGHRYRSEGAMVRWRQVSFHQKRLFLEDSKVGQKAYQIGPRVFKLFKAISNEKFRNQSPFWYPNDIRREYVFPSNNFNKVNNVGKVNMLPYRNSVRGTWRAILKNLNFDYLPVYNCRHSYLTDALHKTKNLKMVKELAGHKKISTTERYARVLGEDVAEAIELIDSAETAPPKVINFSK